MKKTIAIIFGIIVIFVLYKKQHIQPVENPKDSPIFQERLKNSLDRFKKNELSPVQNNKRTGTGRRTASAPRPSVQAGGLVGAGRCGRITLSWTEKEKVDRTGITVKRRSQNAEYLVLREKKIYERTEEQGVRYWVSDTGLRDGEKYEYLVTFKSAEGKETIKGPVVINLTCNEKQREAEARQKELIKQYYQKKGIRTGAGSVPKTSPYQLSSETYRIDPGNSPQKGKKEARVTMVVFTDFECVYCATWARTLHNMLEIFPGQVQIVFKNFPLTYHKHSEYAARAALAAGEQGKFWEMHDMLFKNQKALGMEEIKGYAKAIGIDMSKFRKSMESKELKDIIDRDKAQGMSLGVKNIPTTFINGRSLMGSPPASIIKVIIEDILKRN